MTETALLSILSGALSGFVLGLIGGGGSILATPLLLYVVGIPQPHVAIGTGAVAISVAALTNFSTHAVSGNVRWRNAIVFAVIGVVGALIGSGIGKRFDGQKLLLLFGILMAVVGLIMLRKRDVKGSAAPDYEGRSNGVVAGLALVAGMASGFFGIGGGFLIVPCLIFATRMPMIEAVGSSLLAVTAFSIATAANYARSGLIDWPVAAWFILGGIAGGALGIPLANRLCERKGLLRRIFAIVIFVVAGYVVFRSLDGILRA